MNPTGNCGARWGRPVKKNYAPKPQRRDSEHARVIRGLERDYSHAMLFDAWVALLAGDDPDGYEDRPSPNAPTWVPAGPLRVAVYADRADRGFNVFHAADTKMLEAACDHIAIRAAKGCRQGVLMIEGRQEEPDDDDDDLRLEIPDGRRRPRPKRPRATGA